MFVIGRKLGGSYKIPPLSYQRGYMFKFLDYKVLTYTFLIAFLMVGSFSVIQYKDIQILKEKVMEETSRANAAEYMLGICKFLYRKGCDEKK